MWSSTCPVTRRALLGTILWYCSFNFACRFQLWEMWSSTCPVTRRALRTILWYCSFYCAAGSSSKKCEVLHVLWRALPGTIFWYCPFNLLQVPALRNVKFYTCCDELYLEQSCDAVPLILLAGSSSEKCEVLHVLWRALLWTVLWYCPFNCAAGSSSEKCEVLHVLWWALPGTILWCCSFNLLQVPALRNVKFYTCCDEPYLDITFNITMRRKVGGTLLEGLTFYILSLLSRVI